MPYIKVGNTCPSCYEITHDHLWLEHKLILRTFQSVLCPWATIDIMSLQPHCTNIKNRFRTRKVERLNTFYQRNDPLSITVNLQGQFSKLILLLISEMPLAIPNSFNIRPQVQSGLLVQSLFLLILKIYKVLLIARYAWLLENGTPT